MKKYRLVLPSMARQPEWAACGRLRHGIDDIPGFLEMGLPAEWRKAVVVHPQHHVGIKAQDSGKVVVVTVVTELYRLVLLVVEGHATIDVVEQGRLVIGAIYRPGHLHAEVCLEGNWGEFLLQRDIYSRFDPFFGQELVICPLAVVHELLHLVPQGFENFRVCLLQFLGIHPYRNI